MRIEKHRGSLHEMIEAWEKREQFLTRINFAFHFLKGF